MQVYYTAAVFRVGRHSFPAALFHDADNIAVGAGVALEVRAAVVPAGGRPHGVGPAAAPGLRYLERRGHVRARSQDLRRLHVLRAHCRIDAAQLLHH